MDVTFNYIHRGGLFPFEGQILFVRASLNRVIAGRVIHCKPLAAANEPMEMEVWLEACYDVAEPYAPDIQLSDVTMLTVLTVNSPGIKRSYRPRANVSNLSAPTEPKSLFQNLAASRWAGKGPDARPSDEAYQTEDTLRSENDADGPFPAHPPGGTESARLRRRGRSKGRLDPALATAPSSQADSVPSRGRQVLKQALNTKMLEHARA